MDNIKLCPFANFAPCAQDKCMLWYARYDDCSLSSSSLTDAVGDAIDSECEDKLRDLLLDLLPDKDTLPDVDTLRDLLDEYLS